jgi:aspartyl-tRNA(Asn)/glutamyl-tRNA(Gln) amidotransferase subunit C
VDTSNTEPMENPLDANQRLRLDKVTETNHRDEFQALSEHTRDGLYTVPRVIE